MNRNLLSVLLLLAGFFYIPASFAQVKSATNKDDIEYEAITDDPYDLNKMWLHLYPMQGDAFMTNLNAGYGAQGQYLLKNKFDFRFSARRSYYKGADISFGIGEKTKDVHNKNKLVPFMYLEGGATYHVVDKADAGEAKVVIYTKRYSEGKWASTVPEFIMVPSKVRKIVGIRLGGLYWKSATNLGDAMRKQNIALLESTDGRQLEHYPTVNGVPRSQEQRIYTNISSTAIYLGGSMGRIRNVVVKPKKYDIALNDLIFTGYADIIFSPSIVLEDIKQSDSLNQAITYTYSTAPIKRSPLGFRAGIEGMFNREFSWSYGAEVGMRPSIKGSGLYFSVKVGFALASRLDQRRQAYQKEK
ncbi:MAG: hypothetical protein V4714_05140 [Bacteroidota bacterium]